MTTLLVDAEEVATLQAVSAFIDECFLEPEAPDGVRSTAPDAPTAVAATLKLATQPKPKRVARPRVRRAKRELLQLRAEAKALETQLDELRGIAPCSADKKFTGMQRRWRALAETENLCLRKRVRGQLKIVQDIMGILDRLTNLQRNEPIDRNLRPSTRGFSDTFESLLEKRSQQSLDGGYLESDRVFHQHSLDERMPPFSGTKVVQLSSTKTQTEIAQNSYMPFDFCRTGLALWELGVKNCIHHHTECREKAAASEDQLMRDYWVTLGEGNAKFHVRGNHSMRKYMEPKRVVVVFSGAAQLVDAFGNSITGIELHERGWIVVTKADEGMVERCIVQSCCNITLDVATNVSDLGTTAHHLTEALIVYKRKNFHSIHQELESVLLDSMGRLTSVELVDPSE